MSGSLKIIYSLHRPLSEPIWICKWVCQFINSKECPKNISLLPISFYKFLVKNLASLYAKGKFSPVMQKGLPSEFAIKTTLEFIQSNNGILDSKLHAILCKRNNNVERTVYSVYKAASYYINLTYRIFDLFDNKFNLRTEGKDLTKFPKYPYSISAKTKAILFKLILEKDANFFIPLCISLKMTDSKADVLRILYNFLKDHYGVIKFDYTNSSNSNYFEVRLAWIEELYLLDKHKNIRRGFLKIILANENYKKIYDESNKEITLLGRQFTKYLKLKNIFEKVYNNLSKTDSNPDGYVSLYKIKERMKLGYARFQNFLNTFYLYEHRENFHIFTSNVIVSIDKRKRFKIDGVEALYIKIIRIK